MIQMTRTKSSVFFVVKRQQELIALSSILLIKAHLLWSAKKVPDEVKQKCFKNLDEIAKKKKGKQEHEKEVRKNVQIAIGEDEVIEVESLAGSSSTPRKLGPMDKFTRPIDP